MQKYIEIRKFPSLFASAQAADIAEHWKSRQRLGKALVITDQPQSLADTLAGQWGRLTRNMRAERDAAISSEQLLRLTHRVTQMQNTSITSQSPSKVPHAQIYCLTPDNLGGMESCSVMSVYVMAALTPAQAQCLVALLPSQAVIIAYQPSEQTLQALNLPSKQILETQAFRAWDALLDFTQAHHVDIPLLSKPSIERTEHINEAFDQLLEPHAAVEFLRLANQFRSCMHLAEPLHYTNSQKRVYDTAIILATQVQTMTPDFLGQQFSPSIDDPMFFLNDRRRALYEMFQADFLALAACR